MRAYTSLRTAFLMAAVASTFAMASEARADVTPSTGPAPAGNSSLGAAALKFESNTGIPTVDTDYIGPSVAQVRAVVLLDPVKNGGPLYSIEMPKGAQIEASWAGDKKITLKAQTGAATDGIVKVHHTMSPTLMLKVKVPVINTIVNLNFDATKYVNKLPGARFNFDSRATQSFAPWGFTAVDTKLNAPDVDNSILFSEPLTIFDNILDPSQWAGTLGLKATTKPTFSYKTTKVMITGAAQPIAPGADAVVDAQDGDFMEVMASVEGEMKVAGDIELHPFLSLTKAAGYNFGTTIDIPAYKKAYTSTQKVAFQASLVHIPLPNVHVPSAGIDLGAVKAGGSAKKTVTIENSGEMAATMTFKSSDPSVTVPPSIVTIESKGKYELQLSASAANAGPASAEISVLSNDPDSPVQTFKVGMNGADVGGGGDGEDANLPGKKADADSGCGCKTAGSTTSTGGFLGIGLMALGAVVLVRRRRKAA